MHVAQAQPDTCCLVLPNEAARTLSDIQREQRARRVHLHVKGVHTVVGDPGNCNVGKGFGKGRAQRDAFLRLEVFVLLVLAARVVPCPFGVDEGLSGHVKV